MKHSKGHYKQLKTSNGYQWSGYWDGLHHFTKGDHRSGFLDCAVRDSDITDQSYLFMMDHNLTRA